MNRIIDSLNSQVYKKHSTKLITHYEMFHIPLVLFRKVA